MKNATDNELPLYPKSKINIKNILINSFKFLIFEWKLFAIVLAFHIFKSFMFDQYSYANNDLTLIQQYYEFVLIQLTQIIFELLFWVSIIPLIILAVEDYLAKKQRISFKEHFICISYLYKINIDRLYLWKKMIIRYFVPLFTYNFLFSVFSFLAVCFLKPVTISNEIKVTPEPVTNSQTFNHGSYPFVVYLKRFILSNNCFIVSSLLCVNPNGDFVNGWKYTGTSSSL